MAPGPSVWDVDYLNEEHIVAFENALNADEGEVTELSSPVSGVHHYERTRKISAVSDFAPIHTRVRRMKGYNEPSRKQGLSYHVVRWPLLGFIFLFIFIEFYIYVVIRQCVNAFEWVVAWRGKKGRLRAKLRAAKTYEEWKEAAKALDEHMNFDAWKKIPEDPYYDYILVRKVLRSLRSMRAQDDVQGVLGVLDVCIRGNFAGIETQRIYSETYYKTKDVVESYVAEVEQALIYIRQSPKLSIEEKRRFFRSANTNLGASALCLSGGASFGYYHFGVVRALLDAKMLPRVITGTSAGGLIAAVVCTHTDDELKELLVPRLADRISASSDPLSVWLRRFWKTGARYDTVEWARKSAFFTRGSLTFREAYELTGRVLNISVIPFSTHSPTKLLNHLTSPDCVIWSAIIASAAVPGILNPVVLMQKTRTGAIVPWNFGGRFKDGSLRVDIPLQSLNLLFNVNYPIVSQVNPHVHLFNFAPRGSAGKPVAHRKGRGWRGGFLLSAAEQFLKHELTKNFKVIRDLELMPHLLGQDWSSVFLQRFDGVVTIWPRSRIWDWFRLLTDPDPTELGRMMHVGQMVTWPKLHMIENRFRLEREIYRGRMWVREALQNRDKEKLVSNSGQRATSNGDNAIGGPSSLERTGRSSAPRNLVVPNTHVPIESDAEEAIRDRNSRSSGRGLGLIIPGNTSGDDSGSHSHSREAQPFPIRSDGTSRRRRWMSTMPPDEEDSRSPPTQGSPQPGLSPIRNGTGSQSGSPRTRRSTLQTSGSFLARLRTASFPTLNLPSFSFTRSPTSEKKPAENWSSDSDNDDDVAHPWTGALMTPKLSTSSIPRSRSGSGGALAFKMVVRPPNEINGPPPGDAATEGDADASAGESDRDRHQSGAMGTLSP